MGRCVFLGRWGGGGGGGVGVVGQRHASAPVRPWKTRYPLHNGPG